MRQESTLSVNADLSVLSDVREFLLSFIQALKLDKSEVYDLELAIDEAVTNIILHGYQDQSGTIEVTAILDNETLEIRLRDNARQFDPTSIPRPSLDTPAEQRPSGGGVGVFLMHKGLDCISYRVTSSGGNELSMFKNVSKA